MKAVEIEKAKALYRCRFLPGSFDKRFVRSMHWTACNEPSKTLTWRQKYLLDALVYRYRVQLSSQELSFDLPTSAPVESDYEPCKNPPKQQSLSL